MVHVKGLKAWKVLKALKFKVSVVFFVYLKGLKALNFKVSEAFWCI